MLEVKIKVFQKFSATKIQNSGCSGLTKVLTQDCLSLGYSLRSFADSTQKCTAGQTHPSYQMSSLPTNVLEDIFKHKDQGGKISITIKGVK